MFGAVLAIDEHADAAALQALGRDFSPRIEACGDREVLVDLDGLERLIGDPPPIAVCRSALRSHARGSPHGFSFMVVWGSP